MKLISATIEVTGQSGIELDASIVKVSPCSPKNSQSSKRERERDYSFYLIKTRVESVSRVIQILFIAFTIHTYKQFPQLEGTVHK